MQVSRGPLLLLLLLLPSSQGCSGETDVRLQFEPFTCAGLPPEARSLTIRLGETRVEQGREELIALHGHDECISRAVPFTPIAVKALFAERGYVLAGVPADRDTRLVIFFSLGPTCGEPYPVCLMSEAIRSGGEPQITLVRGHCAAAGAAPASPLFALCSSVLRN